MAIPFLAFFIVSCSLPDKVPHPRQGKVYPETLYSRYLEIPVPSGGVEVRTNPPVLRWPLAKGKEVKYDVRLSSVADFSDPSKILGTEGTPMALFNPHMQLDPATWYWQYRVTGGEWSETCIFKVDEKAVPMASPDAAFFLASLPTDHPKVLADMNDLPGLRSISSGQDFQAILTDAGKALSADFPEESMGLPELLGDEDAEQIRKLRQDASLRLGNAVFAAIAPLCEAYLLTGDEKYAGKAIQYAMKVAAFDPEGVSVFSDFGDARCMLSMALVYDTFHGQLNESQRSQLLVSIAGRASKFYRSWINNQEARVLSGHVWQHILHYFFQSALAVYPDHPESAGWLAYAYELFLARTPILGGLDGGWVEGVAYFRMNMETLVEIPLYIKKYTGFDFIRAHPWYEEQVNWMVFHIPPGSATDGFGDNAEEMDSPGSDYIAWAQEMAKLLGNPLAAWYAEECMKYSDNSDPGRRLLRWTRLTRTSHLDMPEVPESHSLPMARLSHDMGMAAMHSQPGNTASSLNVFLKSGPLGCYGHMLADQNVFNILYGGRKLFYRTGYKVAMQDPHRTGWYQQTVSQNGILINGRGQPCGTDAYGWIDRFVQGGGLAYARGNASQAYRSKETREETGMEKFNRHLVLLDSGIVVIYDELKAEQPAEWSWLIHAHDALHIDPSAGIFSVETDNAHGAGRLWASGPVTWQLADTFAVPAINWRNTVTMDGVPKTYDDVQWHLTASTVEKSREMRFLAVIRVTPKGIRVPEMAVKNNNGELILSSGNWTIKASLSPEQSPGLWINNPETGTVFSSHGGKIKTGGKTFSGKHPGSSLLGYLVDRKPIFVDEADRLPYLAVW